MPFEAGWIFAFIIVFSILFAVLTTRVTLRGIGRISRIPASDIEADDKVKTGCMGILLPLVIAAFGFHRLTHPRRLNRFTGLPNESHDVMALGGLALGIALIVHAFGFVPYARVPFLRYALAVTGTAIIFVALKGCHGNP